MADSREDARIYSIQVPPSSDVITQEVRERLADELGQFRIQYDVLARRVMELREKQRERLREWNPAADKRLT
jgi:hypothetical protein